MPPKSKNSDASRFAIQVAVRVRPLLAHDRSQQSTVQTQSNVVIALDPEKLFPDGRPDYLRENRCRERQYDFDYVFGPKASQDEVFHTAAEPLVDIVLSGFNATVFAYGQTGSGKTHTMLGESGEPGIMGRTLHELFTRKDSGPVFHVSFIELYNEEIRDLLNPGASSGSGPGLDLREDPLRGPVVAGVRETPTCSADDVMRLVHQGNSRRITEGTAANPVSSRSHAVLQILVEQRGRSKNGKELIRCSKLSLIDLAGSERASNTENRGQRLVEGAKINRSLLALGNCINALSKKGMYVNFRDSKLTRLLKDSLGGNTRTLMIAHASPAVSSFEETLNTLKYAHRARAIQTTVKTNWKPVKRKYGEGIMQNVNRLKSQLQQTAPPPEDPATPERPAVRRGKGKNAAEVEDDGEMNEAMGGMLDAMEALHHTRKQVVAKLREQTAIKQSMMEIDDQNIRNRIEISKLQMNVLVDPSDDKENAQRGVQGARGRGSKDRERRVNFGARGNGANEGEAGSGAGRGVKADPEGGDKRRRRARKDVYQLKKAIGRNVEKRKELEMALTKQEKSFAPVEERLVSLLAEVDAQSRAAKVANSVAEQVQARLAKAEHDVSMLEIQKLELEQAQVMQEGMMRERDLALQKVELQVSLRDRALAMLVRGMHSRGYDVNSVLQELAIGPLEQLFTDLIQPDRPPRLMALAAEPERAPPMSGAAEEQANAGGEEEGEDEDEGRTLTRIHSSYKDLASSLRRSARLEELMDGEDDIAEEGKEEDDDDETKNGQEEERIHRGGGGGGGWGDGGEGKEVDDMDGEEKVDGLGEGPQSNRGNSSRGSDETGSSYAGLTGATTDRDQERAEFVDDEADLDDFGDDYDDDGDDDFEPEIVPESPVRPPRR